MSQIVIPIERIVEKIYFIREQKIMLDQDLAGLYGVETRHIVQAVKRNKDRFPDDFMFQLNIEEFKILRSQNVTSSWGGRRYAPFAFTEQGVAMLSSVLKSERAVKVNIAIMRAFVALRKMAFNYADIFRYTSRDHTPAARIEPKIPFEIILLIRLENRSITTIAIETAEIIAGRLSVIPTAVNIESNEKTISNIKI